MLSNTCYLALTLPVSNRCDVLQKCIQRCLYRFDVDTVNLFSRLSTGRMLYLPLCIETFMTYR